MLTSRDLLLIAHVASVVLFLGPLTVATSLFPRSVLRASTDAGEASVARLLGRISRSYALSSLAVPALGVALASESGFWSARWLHVAIVIHAAGAAVLFAAVLPQQRRLLETMDTGERIGRSDVAALHPWSGVFSISWVLVLGLMVVKPW